MSKFFINRPIVAIVIALFTVIVGAVTVTQLPVAQFPQIAPPEVQVTATYVGADAQTIEQSVATPIEQQMSGVDNMNYMYSLNATANGQMRMIVDFDVATDPNTDLILAQSRETQAASQLPAEVNNYGVTVQKSVIAPLMLVALYSPKGTRDAKFLANYAYINLYDQLLRVKGIGTIQIFGAGQYAMRLWVKPDQLAKLNITVPEIISAIQTQNTVNPAGQIGSEPAPPGQPFTYAVRAQGRLVSPEEFEQIVVRETPETGIVRVADVARVELGSQDYSVSGHLNGKPSAVIAVYQLPGSNAVDAAAGVRKFMAEAKNRFPDDLDFTVPVDTTKAVHEGMKEIVQTLLIAIGLVAVVVYLFLQGWRATLIPLLAVPVSLIGTFVFFPVFGFSINTLSLFGLVLAIGLVVDDAIVVVEAVQRHIDEGMAPKEAACKAMEEISGPVVGIALVLSAVFIPTAFIPGITGRLYQQFAVTIAISVVLSAFNALSLSPALSALLLRPEAKGTKGLLGKFFGWFNRTFERATNGYVRLSGVILRKSVVAFVVLHRIRRGRILDRRQGSHQLRSGRRPGLLLHEHPAAQRGVAAADGGGARENSEDRVRRLPEWKASRPSRVSACSPSSAPATALRVRQHEGMGRPQNARRTVPGDQSAPQRGAEQAAGSSRLRILSACHSRSRNVRRRHLHSGGPLRRRLRSFSPTI